MLNFNVSDWFKREGKKVELDLTQFVSRGSAFVRNTLHDAEVVDGKAKIAALDTLNAAAITVLDALETEVARVQAAQDAIAARRAQILSKL